MNTMERVPPKATEALLRQAQRDIIHRLVKLCKWTTTELARAAGLAPSTINKFVNSEVGHTLSSKTMQSVIEASRGRLKEIVADIHRDNPSRQQLINQIDAISAIDLAGLSDTLRGLQTLNRNQNNENLQRVTVVGAVHAGVWVEAVRWAYDEQFAIDAPTDGRYPGVAREGLIVRGPSMNKVYPDGTVVIVVSLHAIGVDPKNGQRVVVQRRRGDGRIEATVKEYRRDDDGQVWLWPSSDHRDHQSPISTVPAGEIEHLEVTALVIGSYRPEP